MAILKNGLLGQSSNGIGNIVTYVMGGQQIARTKPASYNDANSTLQKTVRQRQTVLTVVARTFLFLLNFAFAERDRKRSGYNEFIRLNNPEAVTGTFPAVTIDYEKLVCSKGSLRRAKEPAVSAASGHKVDFVWVDNTNGTTAFANDDAYLVVYCPNLDEIIASEGIDTRDSETSQITVPADWVDEDVECYMYFYNATLDKASDSSYIDGITITA